MRGLFGICLLLLGVSLGAYVYSPDDIDRQVRIADLTRILSPAGHDAHYVVTPAAAGTSYVSDTPLYSHSAPIVTKTQARLTPQPENLNRVGALANAAHPVKAASINSGAQPATTAPHAVLIQPTSWATVVKANPYDRTPVAGSKALKPVNDSARFELIRDLQSQLKQLGCYYGDVDGDWGPGSKRAMTEFMSRVNASLPTDEADYIQLALLDAHRDVSCSTSCSVGYAKTQDGRCRANEIIAHAPPRTPVHRSATRVSKTAPITTASINRAGRLAPSSVTAEPITPPRPQLASRNIQIDDYRERIAKTSPRRAKTKTASRRAPLPGRMTVGGPVPSKVSARERAPGVSALPSVSTSSQADTGAKAKERRAALRKAAVRKSKTKSARKAERKKQKRTSAKKRRYSKASRQRALFRQAFGDTVF